MNLTAIRDGAIGAAAAFLIGGGLLLGYRELTRTPTPAPDSAVDRAATAYIRHWPVAFAKVSALVKGGVVKEDKANDVTLDMAFTQAIGLEMKPYADPLRQAIAVDVGGEGYRAAKAMAREFRKPIVSSSLVDPTPTAAGED